MNSVAAIGETALVQGFVLAGAVVTVTETDDDVLDAWRELGDDVGLVVLSPNAGRALGAAVDERPDLLTVVTP